MEQNGHGVLEDEGSLPSDIMLLRSIDVRYFDQEYTVTVPVSSRTDQAERSRLRERFDAAYAQHTVTQIRNPAQIVTLRLAAIGNVAKPELSALRAHAVAAAAPPGARQVYFESVRRMVDTPVLQREALAVDSDIEGPLIIEERASTTVVQPGDRLRADASGSLIIEIGRN